MVKPNPEAIGLDDRRPELIRQHTRAAEGVRIITKAGNNQVARDSLVTAKQVVVRPRDEGPVIGHEDTTTYVAKTNHARAILADGVVSGRERTPERTIGHRNGIASKRLSPTGTPEGRIHP